MKEIASAGCFDWCPAYHRLCTLAHSHFSCQMLTYYHSNLISASKLPKTVSLHLSLPNTQAIHSLSLLFIVRYF